jgi:hypothetical protein
MIDQCLIVSERDHRQPPQIVAQEADVQSAEMMMAAAQRLGA